ncbi:uncharacterized protein V1510DRAFT_421406 [Dipodascopsis tothii]|uniref:uncharacterized protein n=1 Tax=Dipodascopsis tothii TaxID=44089 RepID=UPI0034CD46BA
MPALLIPRSTLGYERTMKGDEGVYGPGAGAGAREAYGRMEGGADARAGGDSPRKAAKRFALDSPHSERDYGSGLGQTLDMLDRVELASGSVSRASTPGASRPRPKTYHCQYDGCDKSFTRPCRLEEHIRSHTGERPFRCGFPGCEKSYLRDSHLKAHESSHSAERRYKCDECGHGFNTNQHLKRHVLTHERKMPYVCTDFAPCEATFHKQSQLRAHVAEMHTLTKPFPCVVDGCDRSFSQNSRLKAHVEKDHSGVPRYICAQDGCMDKFLTWSAMQKHIKTTHKATCAVCGSVFAKPGILRQHMQVHDETLEQRRKFVCEVDGCNKGFTRKHALVVHVATVHDDKRPFVCTVPGCDRAFGHKRLLRDHLQKGHNKPPSPPAMAPAAHQHLLMNSLFHGMDFQPSAAFGGAYETQSKAVFDDGSPVDLAGLDVDVSGSPDFDADAHARRTLTVQPDIIERLSGVGYEDSGRNIICTVRGCKYRFSREYDLFRHLEGFHRFYDTTDVVVSTPASTAGSVSLGDDPLGSDLLLDSSLLGGHDLLKDHDPHLDEFSLQTDTGDMLPVIASDAFFTVSALS